MNYNLPAQPLPQSMPMPQPRPQMMNDRSQYALSQDRTENNLYPYLQPLPGSTGNTGQSPYTQTGLGPVQNQGVQSVYAGASPGVTINRSAVNPYGAS